LALNDSGGRKVHGWKKDERKLKNTYESVLGCCNYYRQFSQNDALFLAESVFPILKRRANQNAHRFFQHSSIVI